MKFHPHRLGGVDGDTECRHLGYILITTAVAVEGD